MAAPYTLDDTIEFFFTSRTGLTREERDSYSRSRLGGGPKPTPMQGMCN